MRKRKVYRGDQLGRPTTKADDRSMFFLSFHGVGEPPRSLSKSAQRHWLSIDRFQQYLDFIKERSNCRATFDDGNESDYEIVLPALRDRGLKAEFYISTSNLGREGYLTHQQVRALADSGMVIGSHGQSHRSFRALLPRQLEQELEQSRLLLQAIVEAPVTVIALPFGDYDRRVLKQVRDAGYERVLTSDRGPARVGAWLQSRTTVYEDDDVETFERALMCEASVLRVGIHKIKCLVKRSR